MSELLTQEVGSLAKPDWRVQVAAGRPLTQGQAEDIERWGETLGFEAEEISAITHEIQWGSVLEPEFSRPAKTAVKDLAARFAVRLQEQAGLDILYDGEQDRSEMYQYAIERTAGFEWRGRVRAFDNKSYKKAACIEQPEAAGSWHNDEVDRLQNLTDKAIKVPITGAYTLAAWSFDEHYDNRSSLVRSLASDVIRPNIKALLAQGVEWVQIDEPAATTVPNEVPLFIEAFNKSVEGLVGKFSVHICFSDYSLLFPYVEDLENCSQFSLEFANRDGTDLGVDAVHRPAYEILQDFSRSVPEAGIGLGVTSVHDDSLEPVELVRDRVLRAVDIIGDPTLVYPSPDCGLRTRSWDVAYKKLQATVEGTQLAREKLL